MEDSFKTDVRLAVSGDCNAFARLYSLIYKDLYHTALCGVRSPQDASDVVSETVLDAFSSISNLRDINAFRYWIFKILTAKIKKKQAEYCNNPPNIEMSEENLVEHKEVFNFNKLEIAEEVARLNDEERLILSLSVLGGYTSDEIASICGIEKASTVRSKLSRTKEKLRQGLSQH